MDGRKWQRPNLLPFSFFFLSILIGVVAGLGAVAFRGLIALFHNLFFLGKLSAAYDANVHTPPGPWGPWVIFVPVAGAIGVTFLIDHFAPEAKGHGVPEVMDAIYYHKGRIRPVVALVKSIASALSIGSGGSVGREGPIVQIGSSFGSTLGQLLRMPTWQRIILIAAGTGAGIAATFNTPIGGVLFAVELMLHEVSVKTLVPVAIATATATYVGQIFFGPHPSFVIPKFETPYFHIDNPLLLLAYAGLGVILGVTSTVFIRSVYAIEDFFDRQIKGRPYVRHMVGMLLVGILFYLLMRIWGRYYIEGVGYATLQDIFTGTLSSVRFLFLLFILKLFATCVTLGSGASGGIFSPSLYLGATLGGAFGSLLRQVFPELPIDPPAFAVAGMAGVAGGVTGAPMAAIVLIFEMTLDYSVVIPMTITVAVSYGVRTIWSRESIYTMKLTRRGHRIPQGLQANFQQLRRAGDIMERRFMTVSASKPLKELIRMAREKKDLPAFLVANPEGEILGAVLKDTLVEILEDSSDLPSLEEITNKGYVTVPEESTLYDIANSLRNHEASIALVTEGLEKAQAGRVKGFITRQQIGGAVVETDDFFSE